MSTPDVFAWFVLIVLVAGTAAVIVFLAMLPDMIATAAGAGGGGGGKGQSQSIRCRRGISALSSTLSAPALRNAS
jgi:hypothetical protein